MDFLVQRSSSTTPHLRFWDTKENEGAEMVNLVESGAWANTSHAVFPVLLRVDIYVRGEMRNFLTAAGGGSALLTT